MSDLLSEVLQAMRPLPELLDESWAWPTKMSRAGRIRSAAIYALWIADPAKDASRMRRIVGCMVDPWQLTSWLNGSERDEWIRLMGKEAAQRGRIPHGIDEAWMEAYQRLIASGQLREDANGNWTRGQYFKADALSVWSPRARCAAFVIQAVRQLEDAE